MPELSNSEIISRFKSLNKEKESKVFKVPVTSVTGEYFYNKTVAKFELEEVSFTGLYLKVPQIIPLNEEIDVRFSLSKNGPIFWAKGKVAKYHENRIYLEFTEIPPQTVRTIEEFMEFLAEKNAKKMLEKSK